MWVVACDAQLYTREKKPDVYMNEFEWFDLWCEEHSQLLEEMDYPRLVKCCRQRFDRDPDDPYALEALAEAYVLNGQEQDAVDLLAPSYHRDSEHPLYQHAILDALLAMGRQVGDFPWKTPPKVLRMSDTILDECHRYLKPKRKPRPVSDLHIMLTGRAYLLFTEDDLLKGLMSDGRFNITNAHLSILAEVSVDRRKRKTQNKSSEAIKISSMKRQHYKTSIFTIFL